MQTAFCSHYLSYAPTYWHFNKESFYDLTFKSGGGLYDIIYHYIFIIFFDGNSGHLQLCLWWKETKLENQTVLQHKKFQHISGLQTTVILVIGLCSSEKQELKIKLIGVEFIYSRAFFFFFCCLIRKKRHHSVWANKQSPVSTHWRFFQLCFRWLTCTYKAHLNWFHLLMLHLLTWTVHNIKMQSPGLIPGLGAYNQTIRQHSDAISLYDSVAAASLVNNQDNWAVCYSKYRVFHMTEWNDKARTVFEWNVGCYGSNELTGVVCVKAAPQCVTKF